MSEDATGDDDEGLMSFDDAFALAGKITEMADRVKRVHAAVPGTKAVWHFEVDGTRFRVVMTVADEDDGERVEEQ